MFSRHFYLAKGLSHFKFVCDNMSLRHRGRRRTSGNRWTGYASPLRSHCGEYGLDCITLVVATFSRFGADTGDFDTDKFFFSEKNDHKKKNRSI